jgi:hypothetical protein
MSPLKPGDRVEHTRCGGSLGTVVYADDQYVRIRWDNHQEQTGELHLCNDRDLIKLRTSAPLPPTPSL